MSKTRETTNTKTSHTANPMKTFFQRFLWFQLILWTLVPYFTLRVLPLDTLEAILWGQGVSFGSEKHPPLSGWIAGIVDFLTHRSDWGFYLLSQICVVIGLWFIYRIARYYFSVEKSVIAVLLQTLIAYYNLTSPEFNVNVMTLALWPVFIYYFIAAKHDGKWHHWALCGLFAGLNLLTKYTFGLLCAGLFVFVILDMLYAKKQGEQKKNIFLSPKLYFAAVIAIAVASPHILWAFQHGFPNLTYAYSRMDAVEEVSFLSRHVLAPLTFLGESIVPLLAPLLCLLICTRKFRMFAMPDTNHGRHAFHLAICVLCVPVAVIFLMSVCGCFIRSMWLSSVYSTAGLLFAALLKDNPDATFLRNIRICVVVCFAAALTVFAAVNMTHTTKRKNAPASELAAQWEQLYRNANQGKSPMYAVGDIWHAGVMHHYAPSHPIGCIYNDSCEVDRWANWIIGNGALLISDKADDITTALEDLDAGLRQNNITQTKYSFRALFGKEREEELHYAVLKSEDENS